MSPIHGYIYIYVYIYIYKNIFVYIYLYIEGLHGEDEAAGDTAVVDVGCLASDLSTIHGLPDGYFASSFASSFADSATCAALAGSVECNHFTLAPRPPRRKSTTRATSWL